MTTSQKSTNSAEQTAKKMSPETIQKYREVLKKDPQSKVFAALAEALREMNQLNEAERIATEGLKKHPQFVGGYVSLGRIYLDQQKHKEAERTLSLACQVDPENILAHHLLGTAYLEQNKTKEALRAYKMVLFLNPQSEKAKKAIERLESLTADEFEEDVFEMRPMKEEILLERRRSGPSEISETDKQKELHRELSLVDAYFVRNDLDKAKVILSKLYAMHPEDEQVRSRWEYVFESELDDSAEPISPIASREKQALQKKIQSLNKILRALEIRVEKQLGL